MIPVTLRDEPAHVLDPVYMVPDPNGHNIKLNSFKTIVALKSMIILQNLITTNHRKSGKSKDDLKLTDRTRCRDYANPVPCKGVLRAVYMSPMGRVEILIKNCLRLHEKRASLPRRDLTIVYPRSRVVGLEISQS